MHPKAHIQPPPQFDFNSPLFREIVQNEMFAMVSRMYAEMNVSRPLSLDELAVANPSLFTQIRYNAEEAAKAIILNTNQLPTGMPPVSSMAPSSHYKPIASQMQPNTALNNPYVDNRYTQSNIGKKRKDNDDRFSMQDPRGRHVMTANPIIQPFLPPYEPINSKPEQGPYINGFLGEVPVLIDMHLVKVVTAAIEGDSVASAPYFPSKNIFAPMQRIAKRLKTYTAEVMIPPALPGLLFGPLPLQPINQVFMDPSSTRKEDRRPMPIFK